MTVFVGLLRAINVGGTGKLSMRDLCQLCEEAGFKRPKTYIQSGNVVFESRLSEAKVKTKLEQALSVALHKPTHALVRTAAELEALIAHNPFKQAEAKRVIVFFLDAPPARGALEGVQTPGGEALKLFGRELFVHYPEGQGRSKLKVPFAKTSTGRNLNSVARLAIMARELEAT